ncbi:MAG TPA: hypothetical protein DEP60_02055 [Ruminococcaceae bacterium]|nr:hypothetical protein [Oscillospiraceae bacterium]
MRENTEQKKIKVVHIMADGSVRDSVDGYPVPVNDVTKPAYNILATMALRAAEEHTQPQVKSVRKLNG